MKVRCISITNPTTLAGEASSSWVRIGGTYQVVEIHTSVSRPASFRIVDESGSPSLWPATMFESVETRLVGPWSCEVVGGAVTLAPTSFLEPGFWEAYFEGDPIRRSRFDDTLRALSADPTR